LIKHDFTYDTVMIKHLRPRCPAFERTKRAMPPPCFHSLAFLCILFCTH